MADSHEPKKETVRIALPPKPQPPGNAAAPETARIHLPARPPMTSRPMPPPLAQTPLPPAPTRPISAPPSAAPLMPRGGAASAAPASMPAVAPSYEPKKETARIAVPGPKKRHPASRYCLTCPPSRRQQIQMKRLSPLAECPTSFHRVCLFTSRQPGRNRRQFSRKSRCRSAGRCSAFRPRF